jgi:LCP family protein required for cell wall assembly
MSFFKTLGLIFVLLGSFLFPKDSLVKFDDGRTNILIMGKAGGAHEGGDLTDTMMVASVSLSRKSIDIISIPRDTWIPEIRAKINSAYHYGGVVMAQDSTKRVLGVPIHYYASIDFSAFKDVVDALGGIEVVVDNGFTDEFYPITGRENDLCDGDKLFKCRYETVTFSSGSQTMVGETALKFVRSRHAEGDEGTDTAREARQQKVVDAIKDKILSSDVLLNPRKSYAVWTVLKSSIDTDIGGQTAAVLARKVFDSRSTINKFLIPEELLINPPITSTFDKQYVFIPKAGNGKWEDINIWVKSVLN